MNMILKYMLSLFLLLMMFSCENPPFDRVNMFWVKNETDDTIHFIVSDTYPDTSIRTNFKPVYTVVPDSRSPYSTKKEWSEFFDSLPADTLSVFLYSSDTLLRYGWDVVRDEYKILKRYDLSLEDLEACQFTITYP